MQWQLCSIVSEYEKQFASSTEIHVITSHASNHREAAEFCEVTYGGSLIDSNDVNLLYNDVNARQFRNKINDDVNLFWMKESLNNSGQFLQMFLLRFWERRNRDMSIKMTVSHVIITFDKKGKKIRVRVKRHILLTDGGETPDLVFHFVFQVDTRWEAHERTGCEAPLSYRPATYVKTTAACKQKCLL